MEKVFGGLLVKTFIGSESVYIVKRYNGSKEVEIRIDSPEEIEDLIHVLSQILRKKQT